MTIRVRIEYKGEPLSKVFGEMKTPIAQAATTAMRQAGEILKTEARKEIAKGGLGRKWQTALRVNVYPQNKDSLSPAAFMYHKIPYAWVFEQGATIRGKPLLWLPLPSVPKRGTRQPSPRKLGIKLQSVNRGTKPLLVGRLQGSKKAIPLYVGVSAVHLRKRFELRGVAESVASRIPQLYFNNFKG